ncbi:class I SAM-dependent methyltransferase [Flavobacterium sp. 7A]|uniref:class I SAM-dependent methyltransferase n=1 Tax=Flavobacterium sp. 7A TaxID=2940571 RepID=UPI002227AFB5|nr:class I SAM-dependent methyltransferase [Flavobacterium sp. 7A]MCW2119432.1 2-polyprenyl-3-methyl-5-hydroxy-6-metoxy-1,4-benzoquinol methylase [Flavobacterium sp. 7A]
MKLISKRILRIFKRVLLRFRNSENLYYENLFITNPKWNSKAPNDEEYKRWLIIQSFVEQTYYEQENLQILDIGCGRGWLSNLLTKYGNVTGVEPVRSVVGHAKKMFPHLNFICGTTKTILKKQQNKFDLIIASEVIEHISDNKKKEFVQEIAMLLKDKGYLIITTPRKEVEQLWNSYSSQDQPIEDWIGEKELVELISAENFTTLKLERFSIAPIEGAAEILIYQLWLFQKK